MICFAVGSWKYAKNVVLKFKRNFGDYFTIYSKNFGEILLQNLWEVLKCKNVKNTENLT